MDPSYRPRSTLARAGALCAGIAACFVAAALAPAVAGAAVHTYAPAADATVISARPADNFGSRGTLELDGGKIKEFLIRFDVDAIGAEEVVAATLRLEGWRGGSGGIAMRATDPGWETTTVTWANAPAAAGPVLASAPGPVVGGEVIEVDMTGAITTDGAYSFRASASGDPVSFSSSRAALPRRPLLIVETRQALPDVPVLAAAGDIACDPDDPAFNGGAGTATQCRQLHTSDLLVQRTPDLVLALGDTQYHASTLGNYALSYDPSWGRVKPITRPVVGNHEYEVPGAAGYFDYFNGPGVAGGPAGVRSQGWYSYDAGSWHLIALNSNCAEAGGCGPGSPQEQWLRADLAATPSSCILAYMHHPRFSSGPNGDTPAVEPLWQALYEAGADVVLNGHEHIYERFGRQTPAGSPDPAAGIRQFTIGTGGQVHRAVAAIKANSGIAHSGDFGVLELTLNDGGYAWEFVPEAGATFTDSGSDTCSGPTADTEAPSAPAGLRAPDPSPAPVQLDWEPSTDDDGVARYHVLRDGEQVAATTVPGYADGDVAEGSSYTYAVVAEDLLGNLSAPSDPLTVAVSATPPPPPPPPSPSQIVVVASADATVNSAASTGNFGTKGVVEADSDKVKEFLIEFEIAGIGERPVESATLRLHGWHESTNGIELYASDPGWPEGLVTWADAPPALGPPVATLAGPVVRDSFYAIDLTPAISSDGPHSFRALATGPDHVSFSSREAADARRPELTITFAD